MNARNLQGTGIALVGVGSAIFVVAETYSRWFPNRKSIWDPPLLIGIALFVAGLLILVTWLMGGLLRPIREGVGQIVFRGAEEPHTRVSAVPSDLPLLHNVYSKYFGEETPSVQLMEEWIERSKNAFQLVYRETLDSNLQKTKKLVGSYKILPLTTAGVAALRQGQASGTTFKAEHIWSGNRPASSYYIGDVFATDRIAKALVLHELLCSCAQIKNRPVTFFARPLTADGRRVMMRRGFVQAMDGASKPEIGKTCLLYLTT